MGTHASPERYHKLGKSDFMKVVERHEAGEKHVAIARDYGCTRQNIHNIIKKHGRATRRELQSAANANGMTIGYKFSDELFRLLKRAAGYVLMGDSYSAAGRKTGISDQYVRKYCLSVGIVSAHRSRNPKYAAIAKAEGQS